MAIDEEFSLVLKPFVKETVSALAEMAHLKAKPGVAFDDDILNFKFQGYAVCVVAKTSGSISGTVLMHHYTDTALAIGRNVASVMLGEPVTATKIDDEIGEALTEFANTVIGLATRWFHESKLKLEFSAPMFIWGADDLDHLLTGASKVLTIPIEVDGVGNFYLSYVVNATNKAKKGHSYA